MGNYYVCLLDSEWRGEAYRRGEIVVVEEGDRPPCIAWASFDPPAELYGTPTLTHVQADGSGDLVFKYELQETGAHFILKARVGMPMAFATVVKDKKRASATEPHLNQPIKPQLRFGEGAAITSSRGYIRWRPGGSQPDPQPAKPPDPLRDGFEIDWLRWGL